MNSLIYRMDKNKLNQLLKNRPAFRVDKHLKQAAEKVAEIFLREEELRKDNYAKA